MVQTNPKTPRIQPQDIRPEAFVINKTLSSTWDYQASITKVQGFYLRWKTATTELLDELWLAKQAITQSGARTSGRTKKGELSWSGYIKACFEDIGGPSKRTIDSYLVRYSVANFIKPDKLTVQVVTDPSKVVIRDTQRIGDRIQFDIFLPEYDLTYTQSFAA